MAMSSDELSGQFHEESATDEERKPTMSNIKV